MGIMVSKVYEALIEAGASEARAKAAAEAVPIGEQLATRHDLDKAVARLETAIAKLETRLEGRMAKQDSRLEGRMAKLDSRLSRLEWAALAAIALLVKIAFFN